MLNKHRGILKYHLLNNYLCKLNRGLVPIDPKRYISRICCLFYGGRSCIQIHMFVRNMPHSPVTVNLSGMLDRRKLRIKYLYYLYDASVCIYKKIQTGFPLVHQKHLFTPFASFLIWKKFCVVLTTTRSSGGCWKTERATKSIISRTQRIYYKIVNKSFE